MRRVTEILTVVGVLMGAGLVAQARPSFVDQAKPSSVDQAKPSFAGEWKMMVARGQGQPGVDLIIAQDATSMTVDYVRGPAPAPAKVTYKLDGSVSENTLASRGDDAPTEQVSKAMWAGNKLVVTTTTRAGDEKRTFATDGTFLVVETSAPAQSGGAPNVTKVTYQRYQRGFGG